VTRNLFVGGTSSNAGKSWMTTAICAWLRRRGVAVAPFKAQNMSNNSYPCRDGGEIGRAQVAQAEACGLEAERAMNPILLKPNGNGTSQVVVNGQMWKTLTAREYYEQADYLRTQVMDAYHELARRFEFVVIEGAGSVSELNLSEYDLVNLALATRVHSPWVLVADIERGGVFASILGTAALLNDDERALFRGFLINKFHGDLSLFDGGVRILESRTGAACLGVFPHTSDIALDPEDGLALRSRGGAAPSGARIAILRFPCLSNATDFRLLTWADWVTAAAAEDYDFVILPGSKHPRSDLEWMRQRGLDAWVLRQHERGATIIGICGGYQMLGAAIHDPDGVESAAGSTPGLGLLRSHTVLEREKITRTVRATISGHVSFSAYEIHLGSTASQEAVPPFAQLHDGTSDGVRSDRIIGTYLHGALEDAAVCSELFGVRVDLAPKKEQYERLADWFGRHARHLDAWLIGTNRT
jgi:adenosylcobyric acid synthase